MKLNLPAAALVAAKALPLGNEDDTKRAEAMLHEMRRQPWVERVIDGKRLRTIYHDGSGPRLHAIPRYRPTVAELLAIAGGIEIERTVHKGGSVSYRFLDRAHDLKPGTGRPLTPAEVQHVMRRVVAPSSEQVNQMFAQAAQAVNHGRVYARRTAKV